MKKNKLKSAEIGSVSFNFDKLGKITVLSDKDEDAMLEQAMEAGADDLEVSSYLIPHTSYLIPHIS